MYIYVDVDIWTYNLHMPKTFRQLFFYVGQKVRKLFFIFISTMINIAYEKSFSWLALIPFLSSMNWWLVAVRLVSRIMMMR